MRNQFYADARDAMKWTIMYRLAKERRGIFWVVTLRPDKPGESSYGKQYQRVQDAEPLIEEFLVAERGKPKDVTRMSLLFEQLGVPFYIHMDAYPANTWSQAEYWRGVVKRLNERDPQRRDVVFLDPDNGLAEKTCAGEHVCGEHARLVWGALRTGDCFVLYQHSMRVENWPEVKRASLSRALGVDVVAHGSGVVRFYIKEK